MLYEYYNLIQSTSFKDPELRERARCNAAHRGTLSLTFPDQVVEQTARQGGGFVWRSGVGYQYQKEGSQGYQQEGSQGGQGAYVGEFTQGLGWEWGRSNQGASSSQGPLQGASSSH